MTDIRERLAKALHDAGHDCYYERGVKTCSSTSVTHYNAAAGLLAALDADGLTITETETTRVGEAVLRLEPERGHAVLWLGPAHRYRAVIYSESGYWDESKWQDQDTIPEAIEEALR